ncbi:hypothetical protein SDC9_63014 [bioreactor metagenome]|uniref:Uncharacterized protein n=1 Tax=bioreactor metagenome TaxID=1076179 RepID=A0A644XQV2_9ZZZZ
MVISQCEGDYFESIRVVVNDTIDHIATDGLFVKVAGNVANFDFFTSD